MRMKLAYFHNNDGSREERASGLLWNQAIFIPMCDLGEPPPSFSPRWESRALSPIQPDAGLPESPRQNTGLTTRLVLGGITVLAFDQGSGFPLRQG